jgi:TM2 domain-containing membrane protein YozV
MGFDNTAYYPTPPNRRYVKYVPVGYAESHAPVLGYALWLVGFTGAHRFYFGRPLTGALWFFTFGLLGIGWLIDLFLIPGMAREANQRFRPGQFDYNIAWLLCFFLGLLGFHRFYQAKFLTGVLYLVSGGLFGIGWIYDLCTLNEQIDEANYHAGQTATAFAW